MTTRSRNAALGTLCKLLTAQQSSKLTDGQLLQRFATLRDETAFATLVERHGRMVIGVCRAVLRHAQDAEDAYQATFLVLARRAKSIRQPTSLGPWLHGVAYRLALQARANRERLYDRRTSRPSQQDASDELAGRELRQILHEELTRLPQSYRQPLILCYLEGQTQDEAARQLGWTAATVKGRVDRGRSLLRRRLERRGVELGMPLLLTSLAESAVGAVSATGITIRAAIYYLKEGTLQGAISTRAAALAEGWGKAMLTLKLKVATTVALMIGILGAGAGLTALQDQPTDTRPATPNTPAMPAKSTPLARHVDERGDALPESALLRFGNARWRHGGNIYGSTLSPDGKVLATAGEHAVFLWDVATGKVVLRLLSDQGNSFSTPGLAFSPDGTRLGYVRNYHFACIWDLPTGKEIRRFERLKGGFKELFVGTCQFGNQGKDFILLTGVAIETYEVQSGKLARSVSAPSDFLCQLSPDGQTYVRTSGRFMTLGDARTGKDVLSLEISGHCDGVEDGIAFAPDGSTLAVVDMRQEIQIRETASGKIRARFPLPDSAELKHPRVKEKHYEYRLDYAPDGKTLYLGTSQGRIHRWDLAAGKELKPLDKRPCNIVGMHPLPDGRMFLSVGADGVIRCWDLKTERESIEPHCYEGRTKAAYSPDGRWAAIGDARGRIDLWDGRTAKFLRTLQQEGPGIAQLAFAPDGKLLAMAEQTGTVRFWQVPSGRPGAVWDHAPGRGEWYCNGLNFSPDGRLLCVSDYPHQIRVIEVASGKGLWTGPSTYAEAFSPDGARLLVAAPAGSYLTMLDAQTGVKHFTVRLTSNIPENLGIGYTLAYSPDGSRVAVGGSEGGLVLCDGQTGAEIHKIFEISGPARRRERAISGLKVPNCIKALAFSPDGRWFAAAGSDTHVYLWEATTGKEMHRLAGHDAEVSQLVFGPGGSTLFSYGQDGQGYLWGLKPKQAPGPRPELEALWTDLTGNDAGAAYRAIWALSDDPRAADFLLKKLPAVPLPDNTGLAKLIADLDSSSFQNRAAASSALADLGDLAAPALEKALKEPSSLEKRQRLDGLLARLKKSILPSQIVELRAVQALGFSREANAMQVLQAWAQGAPGAFLTRQAQAALARLAGPRSSRPADHEDRSKDPS